MKNAVRDKSELRFGSSVDLLQKIKATRPDLIKAAQDRPLRVIVAKNLARYRREAGLSREALAAKTPEVGARTIQRIEEAGEDSNPTLRVIEALAGALGLAAAALTDPKATIMGEKAD